MEPWLRRNRWVIQKHKLRRTRNKLRSWMSNSTSQISSHTNHCVRRLEASCEPRTGGRAQSHSISHKACVRASNEWVSPINQQLLLLWEICVNSTKFLIQVRSILNTTPWPRDRFVPSATWQVCYESDFSSYTVGCYNWAVLSRISLHR